MSMGADVSSGGASATPVLGTGYTLAQQASSQGRGPGSLDDIMKLFGDPEAMKFMGDMTSKTAGLVGAYSKADPQHQEMLNAHVQNQINKMMKPVEPERQPYMGGIPPEAAIGILRALGIPSERSPEYSPYAPRGSAF